MENKTTSPKIEVYEVEIEKLEELKDALHFSNIRVGFKNSYFMIKQWFKVPMIGERFCIGSFSTSGVTEIIDEQTFKTYSSIYRWKIIG